MIHFSIARSLSRSLVGGWHDAAIYSREALMSGMQFEGPAIVEQNDTTTVVEPGMVTRVDAYGNLMVEVK